MKQTPYDLIAWWRKRDCVQGLDSAKYAVSGSISPRVAKVEGRSQAYNECAFELESILPSYVKLAVEEGMNKMHEANCDKLPGHGAIPFAVIYEVRK